MKKQIQSVIAGAAIVAAMGTIGLGVVGSAQAQSVKSGAVNALNTSATTVNGVLQTLVMRGGPKGPDKNIAAIAAVLKLTEAELKAQVQSGKTLAQIAIAQGVSVQSVVDVLVADMKAHIAQEVASGEITQTQANTMLAKLTAKATERVNNLPPARGEGMRGEGMRGGPKDSGKNIAAVAAVLKLTEAELKTQVHSGKTLAQIATAQSVSVQSVVDVLVTDMKAHIAQEVASGEITQAQANTMLADVSTKVTEMVNTVRPARGEGMRGSGHGPRGHHNNDSHDNDGEHPNA